MDEGSFWLHIGHLRARAEGAIPLMRVLLSPHLAQLSDQELAGFADRYSMVQDRANRWPLVEAVTVAFGHHSDDAFADVQNWLICQGERVYQWVLTDPDLIVEFLGPTGEEVFSEAEMFDWTIQEELGIRPEAAKLVEYQDNRALPQGVRTDLADAEMVHARYPRCAALRERYLNSQLPSIALPAAEKDDDAKHPTRNLALGATWLSRRR
jgi:hypothetical protein